MYEKRLIIGQVYMPFVGTQESIVGRLTGPQNREAYFAMEKGRINRELRAALLDAFQNLLGPFAKDVMLRYSSKAGCGSCPCSPGFHLSAVVGSGPCSIVDDVRWAKTRDRLTFYIKNNGTVDVRNRVFAGYNPREGRRAQTVRYKSNSLCTLMLPNYEKPSEIEGE